MKLRIRGNTIRLRLTKTEVEQFGKEGHVQESLLFGPDPAQHFRYEIVTHASVSQLAVAYENHAIRIMVPQPMAEKWVHTDEVGFEQEVNTGSESIHLLVEKDFQCLHRDDAEEPDNYAHPLANEQA
ncbi:MAG: DUF7009 family protein [Cyclobacteriaceae bacterium]